MLSGSFIRLFEATIKRRFCQIFGGTDSVAWKYGKNIYNGSRMIIKIIDATLREGRQSLFFETLFSIQDEYLDIISRMGVTDIEYRNPSVNAEELENYKRLKNKFPNIRFHVHVFLNSKNVEWVIGDLSVEHISTFVRFPMTETAQANLSRLLHGTSKKIRVGIEHATLVSEKTLGYLIGLLKNEPSVDRISFSDTLGNFTPKSIHTLLGQIQKMGLNNKNIEFHLHNDFGMAAANAAQLLSEADDISNTIYFSTSMFGIGERNGILSYGDLLSNMIRLETSHDLNMEVYGELVRLMEKHDICFNRDPISQTAFTHFASSHIIGETSDNRYHNISPEDVGMKQRFVINNLTGQNVFKHITETMLQQAVSDDGSFIRDLVLKKMKEQNNPFLYLEEVVVLLRKFYKI